jgi:geranylgeranyl diphosphate synthase type I
MIAERESDGRAAPGTMQKMDRTAGSTLRIARVDDVRGRIDAILKAFLAEHKATLAEAHPVAARLADELGRVIEAGGKRLRPLFCYWGFRAGGGRDEAPIARAAASLELLHTFAIIHDDVMDRSARRRGQAATHVAMAPEDDVHAGVSAAILAGDLALSLSDELFCDAGFPPERFLAGFRWFNRMRTEVVAGQYLDLVASKGAAPAEATIRRIARLKSGGYTVEKPLLIGAALAASPPSMEAALSGFGATLGEAFQLRDDVLGAFGDPAETGKDVDGDFREGKRTLLVSRALASCTSGERAFVESQLGREDLSTSDAESIRDIMRRSGALESTLATIEELRGGALRNLESADLTSEVSSALAELADLAAIRRS